MRGGYKAGKFTDCLKGDNVGEIGGWYNWRGWRRRR